MMAANVVQHKTRSRRARVVETPHVRRAHVCACTRVIPRILDYVYVHVHVRAYVRTSMYLSCTYPRCICAEDQPPDPFRRRISAFPFLPPPLPSFFPPRFSFPPVVRPAARPSTYLPVSYTTGRVGTVLVTTFPRRSFGKRRIFSSSLLLSPSLLFIRPVIPSSSRTSKIPPFYFACLCREKDSAGVSFLAGYRGATGGIPETRRGMAERKSDREGEREMIIHSAVITQSPAP